LAGTAAACRLPPACGECLEAIQSDLEGLRRQQSEVLSRLRGHDLFAVFPKADTFTIMDQIIPAAFSRQGPQATEYGTPSTLPELLHFLADFAPDEWQTRSLPELLTCAETFLALRSGLYRINRMIMAHENALKADAALKRWWSTYKGDERFVEGVFTCWGRAGAGTVPQKFH